LAIFARVLRLIGRAELYVSVALLLLIVVSISAQVVLRYGWNAPVRWVEEASTASLIWITFLAGSLIYKEEAHIRIWLPLQKASSRLARYVPLLVGNAVVLLAAAIIILNATPVIAVENRSLTTSLPIALPRGWVFSIPVLVGFVSIAASAVFFILRDLVAIAGGAAGQLSIAPFKAHEPVEEL